jgi:hypothetical protein
MLIQNENSSLAALRGLREIEKHRQREAEQARAKAEKERLARAEARAREERLAKEQTERQAAEAHERAQSTRLGRELDTARTEIAHLRSELEKTILAHAQAAAAAPLASQRSRTASWLGITAGVTMLVGALALTAAMWSNGKPISVAAIETAPSRACPRPEVAVRPLLEEKPAVTTPSIEPSPPKSAPRPRPAATHRPGGKGKTSFNGMCDGRDPLCGIDPGVSDEAGKSRGKRNR